jgi:hypothetical protein
MLKGNSGLSLLKPRRLSSESVAPICFSLCHLVLFKKFGGRHWCLCGACWFPVIAIQFPCFENNIPYSSHRERRHTSLKSWLISQPGKGHVGPKALLSLLFSLLSGKTGRDWFDANCVPNHPVCFVWCTLRWARLIRTFQRHGQRRAPRAPVNGPQMRSSGTFCAVLLPGPVLD